MAVATIEADEAVALSVFVQIMGTPLKKLLVRVILVIFGSGVCLGLKVGTGVPICLQTLTHPYTKKTQKVTRLYTNFCGSTFVFLTL